MTTVAVHQPQYLPWLPYCDKADSCDIFVYLDNVQFQKNGLHNRNQIKTAQGALWLTVPVQVTLGQRICDVRIAGRHWQKKHVLTIEQNYARAAAFERFNSGLKPIVLQRDWGYLADLNIAVTDWMFAQLGITCQRLRASQLNVSGSKGDLILAICKAVGATVYRSGQGAKAYLDEAKFRQHGVELRYQHYHSQPYRQCFPETGFAPDLSALDLILNMGDQARAVMLAGRGDLAGRPYGGNTI
jgi:hypothetical protein